MWGEHRAIRVVWISFRPSEPETWVRILHRPPYFTKVDRIVLIIFQLLLQVWNNDSLDCD